MFLREVVALAWGPNLAHLALAHILQEHPERGHTVFTTNFDDLLMRALMALGYTGRIYGDLSPGAKPENTPDFPQIVHLHGRHTMYHTRNRGDELAARNDSLEQAFRDHIHESSVVVLGYSGWDDTVSRVLSDWPKDQFMIRGNLYWVPWRSRDTMLPNVLSLLEKAPPGRAYVVEDPDKALDADGFLLRLLSVWEEHPETIVERFLRIQLGAWTHLNDDLARYPQYDPHRPRRLVEQGEDLLRRNEYTQAVASAMEAVRLARQRNQKEAEAAAWLLAGRGHFYQGDLRGAEEAYEQALPLFRAVQSRLGEANTLQALGDLKVRPGKAPGGASLL